MFVVRYVTSDRRRVTRWAPTAAEREAAIERAWKDGARYLSVRRVESIGERHAAAH